jgi:hypothetical protein
VDAPTLLGGSIPALAAPWIDATLAGPGLASGVSAEPAATSEPSPREALLAALEVRQAVRRAFVVGGVVAVLVPLVFVVGIAGGRTDEPLWLYPALAFVVFATTSMLAAAVLVARRTLRLAVHPAAIVRRAATVGTLAGGLWLAGAAGLALGPGRPWATLADVSLPWAALLTPVGGWALYTRYKRTASLGPAFVVATLLVLVGALALADFLAFDLLALLPDVAGAADPDVTRLVSAAASALAGGHGFMAALAGHGEGDGSPIVFVAPAIVGVGAFGVLLPSRLAVVALAAGLGIAWLGTCLSLRGVDDADVPTGPDPWPAED